MLFIIKLLNIIDLKMYFNFYFHLNLILMILKFNQIIIIIKLFFNLNHKSNLIKFIFKLILIL